jgi:hypothetical protein
MLTLRGELKKQMTAFNNMSLSPRVKFAHRDKLCPLGRILTSSFLYSSKQSLVFDEKVFANTPTNN